MKCLLDLQEEIRSAGAQEMDRAEVVDLEAITLWMVLKATTGHEVNRGTCG